MDVVFGDVLFGGGREAGDLEVDGSGDAPGELLGEADFSPLAAGPLAAVFESFGEGGEREIEEDHKGQLVLEKVVGHVGAWGVAGEDLVEGQDRAAVEVRLLAEGAPDL